MKNECFNKDCGAYLENNICRENVAFSCNSQKDENSIYSNNDNHQSKQFYKTITSTIEHINKRIEYHNCPESFVTY